MGTAESSRGRSERSHKQEYLDQVLKCVLMRGGRGGLYRRGGASGSTNLDVVKSFDERQLLVNYCHQLLVTVKTMILQSSLSTFIICFNALNSKTFSHLSTSRRTAPARHVRPRLATPTPTPTPSTRRGEQARACGSPTSSYRLHKWCTRGPPFKSVEILLKSRYGIKQLISLYLIVGFKFFYRID